MITDLHSHIIPYIDDGADDIETSIEMAGIAVSEGIERIVCTPHAISGYDELIPEANRQREELQRQLDHRGISLRLYQGFEVYVNEAFLDYEHPERLALNGGRHILIETGFERVPRCMEEVLYLLRITGLQPILAHPERYLYLKKDFEMCDTWKNSGMLFQVNAGSLTGLYGKTAQKTARKLFKKGYVDFIGTDAHSAGRRAPLMKDSLTECRKRYGQDLMDQLLENNKSLTE
ncbi:tyrosine-protein phosphatase [Christensenella intestinihominis]|uniref:tyrosine-protein phosphatase n=1 Tax=Christensenella intestinihominis TaxID=1851429 RepID=UPI00082E6839|nr:CpsB/CapC family capsule biosynthesis tyrosine phosphatase [Christensenella intestinihominis]